MLDCTGFIEVFKNRILLLTFRKNLKTLKNKGLKLFFVNKNVNNCNKG